MTYEIIGTYAQTELGHGEYTEREKVMNYEII